MNEIYDIIKEAIESYLEEADGVELEEVVGALHIMQLQFEAVLRANLIASLQKAKDDTE